MKAVVYKAPYQVAVEEVPEPRIEAPADAIVRITSTSICGSDLHMYEGRADVEEGKTSLLVSHELPLDAAPDAYDKFDKRVDGYTKIILHPAA